ncbi:serine hydrolase [Acaryochloris sp. IP29b_bin.137]|uniref:serine hydrolase n=1 Tax=Acaryochloris sp. IP29b_bin.137 TaxID=2969217 RepID=UPI00262B7E5C|nr:serine hydrolase [Acaryochloris sp. IP29b_bin.137]
MANSHWLSTLVSVAMVLVLVLWPCQLGMANPSQLVDAFNTLPGETSVLVLKDGEAAVSLNAEKPLAIASAFKLQVLAELQQQIDAGQHSWDEVIELKPEWKSIPSGILQDWPDQALLTLQTLASLMISVSDNTAADILIQIVGRDILATASPRNQPFLTTQEVFTLKSPENQDLLETYRQSTARPDLLPTIHKAPLPPVELVDSEPLAPDIEWFFTTQELCQLMTQVADLPLMHINTGIINADNWQQVAFKGGAEPGVLNLTTALKDDFGTHYCVSATWNDQQPLEEYRFFNLFSDTLQSLE